MYPFYRFFLFISRGCPPFLLVSYMFIFFFWLRFKPFPQVFNANPGLVSSWSRCRGSFVYLPPFGRDSLLVSLIFHWTFRRYRSSRFVLQIAHPGFYKYFLDFLVSTQIPRPRWFPTFLVRTCFRGAHLLNPGTQDHPGFSQVLVPRRSARCIGLCGCFFSLGTFFPLFWTLLS